MSKEIDPLEKLLEEEIDSPFAATPEQILTPPVGPQEPIPEASEDTMICLRGPCKHLFELTSRFEHGNTAGSFKAWGIDEPVQMTRICRVFNEGIDLTDKCVWECNHWEPADEELVSIRQSRRETWSDENNKPWDTRPKNDSSE